VSNWTLGGTHTGEAYYDVPPSGRRVTINGTAIVRMRDGKVVEHWGGPRSGSRRAGTRTRTRAPRHSDDADAEGSVAACRRSRCAFDRVEVPIDAKRRRTYRPGAIG
jgi:hypothetical protein